MYRLLNHTNFGSPNQMVFTNIGTNVTPVYSISPSAGLITTLATAPKQIQFGLKAMF